MVQMSILCKFPQWTNSKVKNHSHPSILCWVVIVSMYQKSPLTSPWWKQTLLNLSIYEFIFIIMKNFILVETIESLIIGTCTWFWTNLLSSWKVSQYGHHFDKWPRLWQLLQEVLSLRISIYNILAFYFLFKN